MEYHDRCVFPLLWDFLPSPHTDENGVEMLEDDGFAGGVVQLSSSTGSESAPGAFQFAIARTAFCVSAYVGSASSEIGSPICDLTPGGGGGAFLRCCTFSTMDGWSAGDLVLSRLPKNLSHRRRMSPLSRSRLPFSSLMACCPSVLLPPRPAVIFRCLYRPIMSRCRRSVSSSARYSSKWTSIPLSIAAPTFLHAARSAFHVAVVCLVLYCRRASRFLSSAAKSAALTAGRSHHPSLRGVRLASGRTACAAPRMTSVNSLASFATLARWPAISTGNNQRGTSTKLLRERENKKYKKGLGAFRFFFKKERKKKTGTKLRLTVANPAHGLLNGDGNVWSSHIVEYGSTG